MTCLPFSSWNHRKEITGDFDMAVIHILILLPLAAATLFTAFLYDMWRRQQHAATSQNNGDTPR
jgi:hypothetical protein